MKPEDEYQPVMVSTRGIKFPVGEPLPPVSKPSLGPFPSGATDLKSMTADDLHWWAQERGISAAEVYQYVTFDKAGNIVKLIEPAGDFDPRYGEGW